MSSPQAFSEMLAAIREDIERTAAYTGIYQLSDDVINSLCQVPRHKFVSQDYSSQAYLNRPLPIGQQQTISQPFIVALMTQLLKPQRRHKVLEVGCGSGYQAAILSSLVKQVYSIEVIPDLAQSAKQRLQALNYQNITVVSGNGCDGLPEQAPFDGIIVTAAGEIPEQLLQQLKAGGRMVIPVSNEQGEQELICIDKQLDGTLVQKSVLPVRFVPLVN